MLGYEGAGIAAGNIILFKYKNMAKPKQPEKLMPSDYRYHIKPDKVKFYLKALIHLNKIVNK